MCVPPWTRTEYQPIYCRMSSRAIVRSSRMSVATTATITPATARAGPADASPATSRSRTAMRCSPRSPRDARELSNYAPGADCQSTLACLRGLGVDDRAATGRHRHYRWDEGFASSVRPPAPLDAGNSGTTMRHAGRRAAGPAVHGDDDRRRVAVAPADAPRHGAARRRWARASRRSTATRRSRFTARDCTRLHTRPTVPSAQVKSAVLLAGLHADGHDIGHRAGADARSHRAGARGVRRSRSTVDGLTVSVDGGQRGRGQTLPVPGDFSSAAFWMVAAAALPGSRGRDRARSA